MSIVETTSGIDLVNTINQIGSEFNDTIERHYKKILSFLQKKNPSQAEDLTQNTFEAFFRVGYDKKPQEQWEPLLYKIASNKCTNSWRDQKRHPEESLYFSEGLEKNYPPSYPFIDQLNINPLDTIIDKEKIETLINTIRALTEGQRLVFTLKFLHELPNQAIGEFIGKSEGAVKTLVHRVRDNIKEKFEDLLPAE